MRPSETTREVVLDKKTGQARQAGASLAEGQWIADYRGKMERSLYAFTKGVLGKSFLTPRLHLEVCEFLQKRPPYRKAILLPREHAKTTIVSHSLPIHILIQPAEGNVYFPGEEGSDQRIVMTGETESRMTDALRVVETAFESNEVLRALWPHRCWDVPRKQSKKWNEREMILPRSQEWADPSIRAMGVGAAVTGAHPTVLIKDDLVTLDAANSPVVMQQAIDWHVASRALINKETCLEFLIGTRWHVADLYNHIQQHDPTVAWCIKGVIEDGEPIWPEAFSLDKIAQLQREFGVLFPLLYMNAAGDPSLTDFDMEQIRTFEIQGAMLCYDEDERDLAMAESLERPVPTPGVEPGERLTRESWQRLYTPGQGFRLRGN